MISTPCIYLLCGTFIIPQLGLKHHLKCGLNQRFLRDMPLNAEGFSSLLNEIQKAYSESHEDPLMGCLGIALHDYFDALFQRKRIQEEQTVLAEEPT